MKNSAVVFIICTLACLSFRAQTYDFSCMESDDLGFLINLGSDIEKATLSELGDPVSLKEEIRAGELLHNDILKENTLINSGKDWERVSGILHKLCTWIKYPRGYSYDIWIMTSDEINAFTCGGRIYITSSMLNFCTSDSELAAIIGHEIAHNELLHINESLSREKTAQSMGSIGEMGSQIGFILTTSFNQKNEVHCDFWGIDLMKKGGYEVCDAVAVWNRMALNEGRVAIDEQLFSTHPYSSTRKTCCKHHILSTYNLICK
jgi:predicted Zn-dependent protease